MNDDVGRGVTIRRRRSALYTAVVRCSIEGGMWGLKVPRWFGEEWCIIIIWRLREDHQLNRVQPSRDNGVEDENEKWGSLIVWREKRLDIIRRLRLRDESRRMLPIWMRPGRQGRVGWEITHQSAARSCLSCRSLPSARGEEGVATDEVGMRSAWWWIFFSSPLS